MKAMFHGKSRTDTTVKDRWSPSDPNDVAGDAFTNLYPEDLRVLQVTIDYQMKEEGTWSPTFTRTINVSPRTVVLSKY